MKYYNSLKGSQFNEYRTDYKYLSPYYQEKYFVENFIEQYSQRNLVFRRLLTLVVIVVLVPIHLALWVPTFATLWIPYFLFQLCYWLVAGKVKEFKVRTLGHYNYNNVGISCWYYKILCLFGYRTFFKWVKGEGKKEVAKIGALAKKAYLEQLKKDEEDRKLKPIMDELNRVYPGATV